MLDSCKNHMVLITTAIYQIFPDLPLLRHTVELGFLTPLSLQRSHD